MSYIGGVSTGTVYQTTIASDKFSGNGSQVNFTLSRSVVTANDIEVIVNNVQQSPHDGSYSVSGTTLTFSAAPSSGTDNIYVTYRTFSIPNYFRANTTVEGVVALLDSVSNTSVTKAATPNAVKMAYELAGNAVSNASSYAAAAYSNAVATANTTSYNQAANAYANAVSHANTVSDTAYTNAVSQANTIAYNYAANAYANVFLGGTFSNTIIVEDVIPVNNSYSLGNSTNRFADLWVANSSIHIGDVVLTTNTTGLIVSNGQLQSTGNTTFTNVTVTGNTIANNINLNGNLQIDGNLTVGGNTITLNVTNLNVEDNMIYLNANSVVSNPDLGITGNYNDGTYRHAGVFRDATDGRWKFFHQYEPEPDANVFIDTANSTFALANVQANTFIGNLSGDASTVGSNTASDLRTYSDTVAGTAYTNAVSVANTTSFNQSANAYANAISVANTTSFNQAANAYANAIAIAANATNITSGTLATARLPATANVSTAINVGANVNLTTSTISVGNSTVNAFINSTAVFVPTEVDVGANVTLTTTGFSVGNSTVNTSITSTALTTVSNTVTIGTAAYFVANGNVGIGTSNPGSPLDVVAASGGSATRFRGRSSDNQVYINFVTNNAASTHALIGVPADNTLAFYTSGFSERMRIDSSGNVGIGTTANHYRLNVRGGGTSGDSSVYMQFTTLDTGTTNSDGAAIGVGVGSSPNLNIINYENGATVFFTNSTERMRINASGNVGIGTNSPSGRLHVDRGSLGDIAYFSGVSGDYMQWGSDGGGFYGEWVATSTAKSQIRLQTRDTNAGNYTSIQIHGGNKEIVFNSDGGERIRILSNPNVVRIYSGASGNSPALTFGAETDGAKKCIFLESFWMVIQGHNNEGIRLQTVNASGTATTRMTVAGSGAVSIPGSLSKGSGSFKIDHPLPEKKDTHYLVHSFIEGPQADLIYSGKVNLINGKAIVNIDKEANMTEGTFELLCRNIRCFTSNESGWDPVKGTVNGNILTIDCKSVTSTDLVSWVIIGERKDQHMYDTEWTDNYGKVVVEPLKH